MPHNGVALNLRRSPQATADNVQGRRQPARASFFSPARGEKSSWRRPGRPRPTRRLVQELVIRRDWARGWPDPSSCHLRIAEVDPRSQTTTAEPSTTCARRAELLRGRRGKESARREDPLRPPANRASAGRPDRRSLHRSISPNSQRSGSDAARPTGVGMLETAEPPRRQPEHRSSSDRSSSSSIRSRRSRRPRTARPHSNSRLHGRWSSAHQPGRAV